MARGNQRDKAREKNLKAQAGLVRLIFASLERQSSTTPKINDSALQKNKNTASGTEQQRNKDSVAEIMRQKQAAGKSKNLPGFQLVKGVSVGSKTLTLCPQPMLKSQVLASRRSRRRRVKWRPRICVP